jgi:hypothetical protein
LANVGILEGQFLAVPSSSWQTSHSRSYHFCLAIQELRISSNDVANSNSCRFGNDLDGCTESFFCPDACVRALKSKTPPLAAAPRIQAVAAPLLALACAWAYLTSVCWQTNKLAHERCNSKGWAKSLSIRDARGKFESRGLLKPCPNVIASNCGRSFGGVPTGY